MERITAFLYRKNRKTNLELGLENGILNSDQIYYAKSYRKWNKNNNPIPLSIGWKMVKIYEYDYAKTCFIDLRAKVA